MENVTICRATAAMVDDIAALEPLCFTDPWSHAGIENAVTSPLGCWYCAYLGKKLLGAFGAQVIAPEAEILTVGTHPDYRHRGVARALLDAFFTENPNVDTVFLEVRRSNIAAQKLYAGYGFTAYGVRPSYYEHPVEDAILMSWTRPGEELC